MSLARNTGRTPKRAFYRRSLYTFWKRNSPAPAMLTFERSSLRSECQVRRQRSSTPLQALVMLNDPQMLEASRVLAANSLGQTRSEVQAADVNFPPPIIGRAPTDGEREIITQFYETELNYFDAPPAGRAGLSQARGHHETDLSAGPAKVAAMARVANAVMNSQEGYYKN